jgi:hypothetical protein
MAFFVPGDTQCPLCGAVVNDSDERASFPQFRAPGALSRYADSVMHARCYDTWSHRAEFQAAYEVHKRERNAWAAQVEAERRARHQARDVVAEARHAQVMDRVRAHGASCPRCGACANEYREFSKTPPTKVACGSCKHAIDPFDLLFDG